LINIALTDVFFYTSAMHASGWAGTAVVEFGAASGTKCGWATASTAVGLV